MNNLKVLKPITQKDNHFKTGLNVVQCELDVDLFVHYYSEYLGEIDCSDEALVPTNWVQLMVSNITIPNAKCYVSDGDLVYYNTKTQQHFVAGGHQLVCRAEDAIFLHMPNVQQILK